MAEEEEKEEDQGSEGVRRGSKWIRHQCLIFMVVKEQPRDGTQGRKKKTNKWVAHLIG